MKKELYLAPDTEVLELQVDNDVLTTSNVGGNASNEDYYTDEI